MVFMQQKSLVLNQKGAYDIMYQVLEVWSVSMPLPEPMMSRYMVS